MQAPILAFIGGSTGGGEILIILVVMLLLFGSKKLPHMARSMGRAMEEFRRASREVTDEIMRADLKDEPKPVLQPRALASTDPEKPQAEQEPETSPVEPKAPAQAVNRDETLS
ncbi:MAG: twin-arginine translocase TatA/TatE family subunit [Verrucomicrobia bacterium]|nr:twin-arginine translocase TatA/TatE family subunit [Verrucomicrobiota bacterium]